MEYLLVTLKKDPTAVKSVLLNGEPIGTTNTILRVDAGYVFVSIEGISGPSLKILVKGTTQLKPRRVTI